MALTIHKFAIPIDDKRHAVALSQPAQITRVEVLTELAIGQPHPGPLMLTFWAVVDTDNSPNDRYFTAVGTGHPLPSYDLAHVWGTAPVTVGGVRGALVFHLVETIFAADPTDEVA